MACTANASARATNHSKTRQSLTTQRDCATTTMPCARVRTHVKRMISRHVSSPMAASRRLKFPNGSHTHHEGFSGKPLHWPTDKNHSPFITHHGHVTETSNQELHKANHSRRPASKKALTRVDSARAILLGLVCCGHQQRMNCSQKIGHVYAVSGKSAKTASDLKHKSLQTALRGGSAFVPRSIPLLDQHDRMRWTVNRYRYPMKVLPETVSQTHKSKLEGVAAPALTWPHPSSPTISFPPHDLHRKIERMLLERFAYSNQPRSPVCFFI